MAAVSMIMTEEDYKEKYRRVEENLPYINTEEKVRHCKAEVFEKYISGTLAVPWGEDRSREADCRFYLDRDRLLLIGDPAELNTVMEAAMAEKAPEAGTSAGDFFLFLKALIGEEGDYIDNLEDELTDKENVMLAGSDKIPADFEEDMQKARRALLRTNRYYQQLADLGQMLAEAPGEVIDKKTGRYYRFFADRMLRLLAEAEDLRKYSSQIYDMYQSRINIKQNKVMQFLTVITTIFMPLTLITGWYGMNFRNMPELAWKYGYVAVIIISALLLLAELCIFKRKKWM